MNVHMSKEIRDRVFAAADALYEQSDRESFPTVDAVRKAARVNMNDASAAMKEWRRSQTAQVSTLAVQVPEAVLQAAQAFVASLWGQSQELTNESLRAAQAGWESEREELDVMRKELADAYESQAAELEQATDRRAELEASEAAARADVADLRVNVAEVSERLATSEARAGELRDHARQDAHNLRAERDKALEAAKDARAEHKSEVKELRSEIEHVRSASTKERNCLTGELSEAKAQLDRFKEQRKLTAQEVLRQAERHTKIQAELDVARKESRAAREDAAHLRGRVEALEQVLKRQGDKKNG